MFACQGFGCSRHKLQPRTQIVISQGLSTTPTKKATIGGAIAAIVIIGISGYFFSLGAIFDYSKAQVASADDREFLSNQTVRRSVESAISDPTTKLFLVRFDNPELKAQVNFHNPREVDLIKRGSNLKFLPDGVSVIEVFFDSDTGGAIPEHPMLSVYLEPDSFSVLGTRKAFW